MTRKECLASIRKARQQLKAASGFNPNGPHYKAVLAQLDKLEEHFKTPPTSQVPLLGSVIVSGKSVLAQDLTHATDGVPLYPAFDDGIGHPGMPVIAPEAFTVTMIGRFVRRDGSPNGRSVYGNGISGLKWVFGHVESPPAIGAKIKKGAKFCTISPNHEMPHVHVGINAERLLGQGKELKHHTDYTHGAPLVGVQLARIK